MHNIDKDLFKAKELNVYLVIFQNPLQRCFKDFAFCFLKQMTDKLFFGAKLSKLSIGQSQILCGPIKPIVQVFNIWFVCVCVYPLSPYLKKWLKVRSSNSIL